MFGFYDFCSAQVHFKINANLLQKHKIELKNNCAGPLTLIFFMEGAICFADFFMQPWLLVPLD